MQIPKLGLELRKLGTLDGLYDDVDKILANMGIASGEVSASFQVATICHSLQKMFKIKGYFDVSTIRSCADIAQIVISTERMDAYQAVHCLSWSDMTPEYKQMITAMVLDDFRTVINQKYTS